MEKTSWAENCPPKGTLRLVESFAPFGPIYKRFYSAGAGLGQAPKPLHIPVNCLNGVFEERGLRPFQNRLWQLISHGLTAQLFLHTPGHGR